ncbi:MAG: molybdopterin molybdotransferase MoeA [Planctomyces sp.]|nr:molybdopterin molybdotransferase MoeA [Planctomyces sp.]
MSSPSPLPEYRGDVRMRGFAVRSTVEDAWSWIDTTVQSRTALDCESVELLEAAGRVLTETVVSQFSVPAFSRSMMDGYAVRSEDTYGASPASPLPLRIIGSSFPGRPAAETVRGGTAVRIMTGAPVPNGADAVLPVEFTTTENELVQISGEVSPGKNIGIPGEDIRKNESVLNAGRWLRPQDVGLLSAIGRKTVTVRRRPRIRILVSGNEILPPGNLPTDFRIPDSNGPMLKALAERDGACVTLSDIIPDDPAQLLAELQCGVDVVLVSGGSSVGQEDHIPVLLRTHGELAIHGIAMRPSSPAGMGRIGRSLVFLLPGNPVSCLCAYDFFAGRAIRMMGGRKPEWTYHRVSAPLKRKLVSTVGRVDYARVRFENQEVEPIAISGASVLSSTTRADGFVVIPADSEGYAAGTSVDVYCYE